MRTLNVSKYVPPVIVVLNEVALGKSDSEPDSLPCDSHIRHREITALIDNSLHLHIAEHAFVQRIRREGVCLIDLKRIRHKIVRCRECRSYGWPAGV